MKRKIAAILAADVAGYSRLVAEDEEETLRRLADYRSVFDDFISRVNGRIFNTAGDAVLAEFPSAVEAVRCAIDIQESMRTRNLAYPQHRRMDFRIGLTIGDVVERDGDLLGDGVNIAARLEGLAQPGGICISQSVHDAVANKIGIEFKDIGEQSVKNIPRPVHAFLIGPQPMPAERRPVLNVPPKQPSSSSVPLLAGIALAALLAGAGGLWFWHQQPGARPEAGRIATAPATLPVTPPPPAAPAPITRPPLNAMPPSAPQQTGDAQQKGENTAPQTPPVEPTPTTTAQAPKVEPPIAAPPAPPAPPAPLTPVAPPLPADPAAAFKALVERGGIVNEPKTAPEFYHNARSYETRGDATNARRAYVAFAGLKLNVIDPMLRLAALLRVQEGRAGAREVMTELASANSSQAVRAVQALQFDGADRRARLEQFVAENPDFVPARYLLADEYGEDRLGMQQTLGDRRKELEHLTVFLNADRDGKLQPFFMDHSVLSEWLDKARRRATALETFMKTATTIPVASFMRTNAGWMSSLSMPEAATEIAWRIKGEGDFKSTPLLPTTDPRTGKPMPMPSFELAGDTETAEIEVKYRDASGSWLGPFDLPFEWKSALMKSQRQVLDQFRTSWVAFRNEAPYDNLLYFTHLVSYRCSIEKVEIGFDNGPVSTPLPLPACSKKDPFAIPSGMLPYIKMNPGVKSVTVKLTYADGTEAEPVQIRR